MIIKSHVCIEWDNNYISEKKRIDVCFSDINILKLKFIFKMLIKISSTKKIQIFFEADAVFTMHQIFQNIEIRYPWFQSGVIFIDGCVNAGKLILKNEFP